MSRIRTIKPEFFTSEDITSLTPLARVFYIALWCEADREGRLDWKLGTLKMRYLPGDDCDVAALADELTDAGLIVLYEVGGKRYAEIPTFKTHQVINNRESESTRPARVVTRESGVKAEGKEGKEGKGKEDGESKRTPNGSRLPPDWEPSQDEIDWAKRERPDVNVPSQSDRFRDYWTAKTGKEATKLDWSATWRNWIRNAHAENGRSSAPANPPAPAKVRPRL
jgi:hypothetical protein